jgi:hypothetical protein
LETLALDYFGEDHLADLGLSPAVRQRLLCVESVISAEALIDRLGLLAREVRP